MLCVDVVHHIYFRTDGSHRLKRQQSATASVRADESSSGDVVVVLVVVARKTECFRTVGNLYRIYACAFEKFEQYSSETSARALRNHAVITNSNRAQAIIGECV